MSPKDERDRAGAFLQWALETFGDIALDPRERVLRFLEEAIELAQAARIDAQTILAIVDRVSARPLGDLPREIGQCLVTLELLARVFGIDADQEATAELARVKAIPRSEWTRRHQAKVVLGIAAK